MIRTQLSSGRARQRRRFTSVPTIVSATWVLSEVQAQLFEVWYKEVILDGAAWFECPLKTPVGMSLYEARFTGIYSGPNLYGLCHWRINAELEIRDRQTLAPGWGEFPEFVIGSDIIDRAINQQWPKSRYQIYMGAFDYAINEQHPQHG